MSFGYFEHQESRVTYNVAHCDPHLDVAGASQMPRQFHVDLIQSQVLPLGTRLRGKHKGVAQLHGHGSTCIVRAHTGNIQNKGQRFVRGAERNRPRDDMLFLVDVIDLLPDWGGSFQTPHHGRRGQPGASHHEQPRRRRRDGKSVRWHPASLSYGS